MNYEPKVYVKGALPSCRDQGCRAPELAALARQLSNHERAVLDLLNIKGEQMKPTQALWCEQGGHAFSEKDTGVQVLTIAGRGPDGQTVEETRTSCGECAALAKTKLGKARNSQPSQLPPSDS